MNAAIEAAVRAHCSSLFGPDWFHGEDLSDQNEAMSGAIIAFLRNCEVSAGMVATGDNEEFSMNVETVMVGDRWLRVFKAMAAQLATELEGK